MAGLTSREIGRKLLALREGHMRSRPLAFAVVMTALAVPVSATAARTEELYVPLATKTVMIAPLKAVATIRANFDGRRTGRPDLHWKGTDLRWNGLPCGTAAIPSELSYVVTGQALTIRCIDGSEHVYSYSKLSKIRVIKAGSPPWTPWWMFTCLSAPSVRDICIQSKNLDELRTLADSFRALSSVRPTNTPASDAPFVTAVGAAKALGDRSEAQRRTMIEAEALLKANRTEDALRLYEERLRTSPDWALGHYNLALIYASLELLPEAITEMRRYLYLAPDAEDARAARDQVYAWEALLPR